MHGDFCRAEILDKIKKCNIPGADSRDVQAVLIAPAKSCGFTSEAKGLFKNYQVSGLGQNYHLSIGNDGIIFEVEQALLTSKRYCESSKIQKFVSHEEYFCTAFHELVHSTGHVSRLDRTELCNINFFGDHKLFERGACSRDRRGLPMP